MTIPNFTPDERKLDYHWVTAVHKYGLNAAAATGGSGQTIIGGQG